MQKNPTHSVDKFGQTILHRIIQDGTLTENRKLQLLTKYVKGGIDINHKNKDGYNIFMESCMIRSIPLMEKCIEIGANIDDKNARGSTSLILACCFNHNERIIKFLIERGADTWLEGKYSSALGMLNFRGEIRNYVKRAMILQRLRLLVRPRLEHPPEGPLESPLESFQKNEIYEPKLLPEIVSYLLPID